MVSVHQSMEEKFYTELMLYTKGSSLQLMAAVKIPGSQLFDTKIAMHISRHNSDAILSQ